MLKITSILLPLSLLACNGTSKDTSTSAEETSTTDGSSWAKTYVEELDKSVQLNPELKEINKLEKAYLSAAQQVLNPWKTALLNKDAQSFSKLITGTGLQWAALESNTKSQID